jgi:hypothetical protein
MTEQNILVLQSCTDAPRVEHGLCSETNVQSSDDSIEVISIKIEEEEIHIKEEVEPIAISFSSIKDEPEVSPQTFLPYLRLPSVIMPSVVMPFVCLPFHIKQLPIVNGNGLYIFTVCVNVRVE